jgi:hypothetical protein
MMSVMRARLIDQTAEAFRHARSENIGGLLSMAGSSLFLFGGNATGVLIALSFLFAEIILTRFGHTRGGYSGGCLLFASGDAVAVTSDIASGNGAFQAMLAIMAAAWMLGAVRAPLAWYGERSGRARLVTAADMLQPIAGMAILVLRVPGIVTAAGGASYLGAAAVACWGASDILVGRLHDLYRSLAERARV